MKRKGILDDPERFKSGIEKQCVFDHGRITVILKKYRVDWQP
jgi:hypothetical protein